MRLKFFVATIVGLSMSQAVIAQDPAPPVAQLPVPGPAPDPATDQANILNLDLSTGGRVTIQLRPDVAPRHVERMKTLVCRGFYDGVVFHRVIEGFMAQTGDPTGTGQGGSDLPDMKAEFNLMPHLRGTVSAARTNEPDTANSQFFIMFLPRTALDRRYTVFGRVIAGMQFVDAIERGEPPANPSKVVKASLAGGCTAPTPAPVVEPVPAAEAVVAPVPEAAAEPTAQPIADAVDAIAAEPAVEAVAEPAAPEPAEAQPQETADAPK